MAAPTPERMIELDAAIAALQKVLDAGVSSVTVDGRTTVWDLDSVRIRISELRRERSSGDTSTQVVVPVRFS
jgi:hypothetical protein